MKARKSGLRRILSVLTMPVEKTIITFGIYMKILIKNGKLLLRENGRYITADGDMLIEDRLISKVALKEEQGSICDNADKVIDASGKLVMPGLINAHTHAYMSVFRNMADDLDFFDWLGTVNRVEDYMTEEDCYWTTLLSIIEMLQSGTTCFVDMNIRSAKNGAKTGPEGASSAAANESGIRAYISRGLVGEADDKDSLRRFREFFGEADLYKDDDRVKFLLGPHAPYSVMPSLLKKVTDYGHERHMMATIHISESETEMRNMAQDNGGITPVQYVDNGRLFELPVIAAHCVNATDDDIKLFKEKNVSVAINPKSNMKLGNGFAPVDRFLEAGINVCLGTDGSGSNNTQNMFQEMNIASLVYKGKEKKAKCVDAADVLDMATVNGAKALGMEGKLGTIAEGAIADIIILDLNVPQFVPKNNTVSGLVYSAKGSEVETAIVNGKVLMENRQILTINVQKVMDECEKIAARLR